MFQNDNKMWNVKGRVEATLQQVASEVGAARQGQGSDPCFSGVSGALPVIPWKWSEYLFCSPLDGCGEKMAQ